MHERDGVRDSAAGQLPLLNERDAAGGAELTLSFNQIGVQGATAIAEALQVNAVMETLHLGLMKVAAPRKNFFLIIKFFGTR